MRQIDKDVVVAALLALGMGVLQWGGPSVMAALIYDRSAIASGEWWRLLSGSFIHWTYAHWLMNVSGLILLAWIFAGEFGWCWWFAVLSMGASAVGMGLWFKDPQCLQYAGFSGMLHGLLYFAVIAGWRRHPGLHLTVLMVLLARLLWEHTPGYNTYYLQAWIGKPVAVDAHLMGALSGALLGLLWHWSRSGALANRGSGDIVP